MSTAAAAFIILIAASTVISGRVKEELIRVQNRYLPRVELGPQLTAQFERLQRSFQDAVAAHDPDALDETRQHKDRLLQTLTEAGSVLDPTKVAVLRNETEEYYAVAYDVSRRLLGGETGEAVVTTMGAMQTKRARALEAVKAAAGFDRGELEKAFVAAANALDTGAQVRLAVSIACLLLVVLFTAWLSRGLVRSLADLSGGFQRFGGGDFAHPIPISSQDELGDVSRQANQMADSLKQLGAERDRTDWLKSGHGGLANELRGELEPKEVADRAIRFLAGYIEAPVGALYYADQNGELKLYGHHALIASEDALASRHFRKEEGLVGQAAQQDKIIVIKDPPADHFRIRSGLGESSPRTLVLLPLTHADRVTGVMEFGLLKPWSETDAELLLSVRETLAIAIEVARARMVMRDLLKATQEQAERLSQQEEELRASNEELQSQQEELRQTNEELTHQAEELDAQRRALEDRNVDLGEARERLETKAAELTTVSAYKSQFLANMSHELRTPLNSMLLLSNLLSENEKGNLTEKQVEYSRTIHSAGKDLLALISQVLDLSKVESGKQDVNNAEVPLREVADRLRRVFAALAEEKGLHFVVEIAADLPETITTDKQRLDQIVTNLVGNAIKFTQKGEVTVHIDRPRPQVRFRRTDLDHAHAVAFSVSDTGIGIATENQDRVFAPFEQVDGAADRRYGGTGLGLGIARELASLLGGELQLDSVIGKGSTFTCTLPERPSTGAEKARPRASADAPVWPAGGEVDLLLIEDDSAFTDVFADVIRSQGLTFLVAPNGETGLRLAKTHRPKGIILDVKLPDMDGWKIMEAIKADPATAKIPVHFLSALDASERGLAMGAVGYLTKPASRIDLLRVVEALMPRRPALTSRVLVVEDDAATGESLVKQLTGEDLEVHRVMNARDALAALKKERFGCVILDLSLPDMDGLDLLRSMDEQSGHDMPSVVVYTARALTKAEANALEKYTEAVVLKEGSSSERLLEEVRLFVRRLKEGLGTRRMSAPASHPADVQLGGRRVLLVDDDMRTVYALSATLRAKGVEVLTADTGITALAALNDRPDVELVLMDIMMPEMDGYEAIRRIRQDTRFRTLPIIALTAKAMKGDREKCLEAGATDYLSKPIDPMRLIALLHDHLK
ncbi:MAG TPA: response regulator [Polyangia bacterium]|nr:response regulator [Polyangia bacterium]